MVHWFVTRRNFSTISIHWPIFQKEINLGHCPTLSPIWWELVGVLKTTWRLSSVLTILQCLISVFLQHFNICFYIKTCIPVFKRGGRVDQNFLPLKLANKSVIIAKRNPGAERENWLCSVLGRLLSHSCSIVSESSSESCIANYGRKIHFLKLSVITHVFQSASGDAGTLLTGDLIDSFS